MPALSRSEEAHMADADNVGGDAALLKRLHHFDLRGSEVAACFKIWLAQPGAARFAVIFKATPKKDGTFRVEVFRGRRVWE